MNDLTDNGVRVMPKRKLFLAFTAIVFAAALIALLGWIFHLPAVLSTLGDAGRMSPDTSAFLLPLAVLMFLTLTDRHRRWRFAGSAAAAVVALILAALNLAGWLAQAEGAAFATLGFFVPSPVPIMALATSLAFLFSAVALMAISLDDEPLSGLRFAVALASGTAVLTLSSICLVVFALRFPIANSWLPGVWMIRMALETALLFTICGVTLIHEARRRMSQTRAHTFSYLGIVVCVWLLLLLLGINGTLDVALRNNLRIRDTLRESQQAENTVQTLVASVRQAEGGQRGYLLTKDPAYLRAFDTGVSEAKNALAAKLPLGESWPEVEALRSVLQKKLSELDEQVSLQQAGRTDEARTLLESGKGRGLMERIEDLQKLIGQRMEEQTDERNTAYWDSAELVRRTTLFSYSLALGLLACIVVLFRGELGRRKAIERELRASEATLEARVAERTAELQASESRFREMMQQSPMALVNYSMDGTPLSLNPAFAAMFGSNARELQGGNIFTHPQLARPELRQAVERIFSGEVVHFGLLRHDPAVSEPTGPTPWVDLVGYPIKDGGGQVREVVLQFQDVTAREEALHSLRESEAHFRELTNLIPQVVWRSDATGVARFFNERWYEMTGAPRDVVGEAAWLPYLCPEDAAAAALFTEARFRETAWEGALRLWNQNERQFRWHLVRQLPLRNGTGEICGWLGTSTDIHDHKRTELDMARTKTIERELPVPLG